MLDGRKQERKRKSKLAKEELQKLQAKEYRAWVRQTRKDRQEIEKQKKRGAVAGHQCLAAKSILWWLLLFAMFAGAAARPLAGLGTCLVGLWSFLPLGWWLWWLLLFIFPPTVEGVGVFILSSSSATCLAGVIFSWIFFMAPKKKRKVAEEEEVLEEPEVPEGKLEKARKSKGSKAEGGEGVAVGEVGAGESGGAAGSGEKPKRRRKKEEPICLARVWGGIQYTFTAKPESKFCGIHGHSQTYGTVEEVPTTKEELPEAFEDPLAVVPRAEAPAFQVQQNKMDIDMFLLRLSVQEVTKVAAFWQSQQGPPLKIFSERPSLYQLFSHPLLF